MEQYYIQYYDTTNPDHGYNLTQGGGGITGFHREFSEETRKKMSDKKRGRHLPEETKRKLSLAKKNRRPHSWTNESRKRLAESHKKPVRCMETGMVFGCADDAVQYLNKKCSACIRSSCREGDIAYGYHWEYVEKGEYDESNQESRYGVCQETEEEN